MTDDPLDRLGRRGGNIAAHLVHSQYDALGDAPGARNQPGPDLLGRLQRTCDHIPYDDHQLVADRSRGTEGA